MLDTQTIEAGIDPISSSKVAPGKTIQKQGNHLGTVHNSVPSVERPKRIWPEIRSIGSHRFAFGKERFLFLRLIN